jgi:pimeloyl-ACP methyl ester carboxylesterase
MMKWAKATTVEESLPYRVAASPFFYARWDDRSRAHASAELRQLSVPAAEGFYAGPAIPTEAVRQAVSVLAVPALVVVGALDPFPTPATGQRLAALLPNGKAVVQPDTGHYPWVDDARAFALIVREFLQATRRPRDRGDRGAHESTDGSGQAGRPPQL